MFLQVAEDLVCVHVDSFDVWLSALPKQGPRAKQKYKLRKSKKATPRMTQVLAMFGTPT